MIRFPEASIQDAPFGVAPLLTRHRRFTSGNLSDIRKHTDAVFTHSQPVIEVEDDRAAVHFVHNQADLLHSSFHFLGYHCADSAVRIDLPAMDPYMLLQFSWTGEAELQQDGVRHRVGQGHFLLIHPDSRMSGRLLPGYQTIVVRLNRLVLEQTLARHLGRRPSDPLRFEQSAISINGVGHALTAMILSICANLESDHPLLGRNPLSQQMENMLYSLVLYSLPHQYSAELESGASPVPFYVRRVENFVREHARETLTFDDLVEAAGTSTRTLHEGFRRFRNTTPMTYLRNFRLELARLELQTEDARTVTQIALDCGFSHLSKFSMDYQERYGEKPSDTRRHRVPSFKAR